MVTAVANQRPDLFAAVIGHVPVTDMMRYHMFTGGHMWSGEYGCSEEQGAVDYLMKYSPLHTIHPVKYPAMLILTGDHDDRVVPLHTYKYMAELQNTAGSIKDQNPLIMRIEVDGGHSGGSNRMSKITETVDVYAFIAKVTGTKL